MIGQPAKVLRPGDVRRALTWAGRRRHGARNRAMILLDDPKSVNTFRQKSCSIFLESIRFITLGRFGPK